MKTSHAPIGAGPPGYVTRMLGAVLFLLASLAVRAADGVPRDERTWAAFLGPLFEEQMARSNIPGAVCAVVTADGFTFLGGYGVASRTTQAPMDARNTLVRVASVSKVVTGTAMMQLVEQGAVALPDEVADYLPAFPGDMPGLARVTVRDLLTHTAGFDERFFGMAARTKRTLGPLGTYLGRRMPPRVFAPGRRLLYSNHGIALAGYVIEVVSGERFEDYMTRHIFAPLGMNNTTFDLPDVPPPNLATGYIDLRGERRAVDYDFPQTVPASSLISTAADMAKFMRAHLNEGRLNGAQILRPATVRTMHTRQFSHHPDLPGIAITFFEREENGLRILEHGGLIWGGICRLQLIPEAGIGLFIAHNSQSGGLERHVSGAILDRFFPHTRDPRPEAPRNAEALLRPLYGSYRHVRHARTTAEKFATVAAEFIREVHITRAPCAGVVRVSWVDSFGRPRYTRRMAYAGNRLLRRLADADTLDDVGRMAFAVPEDGAVPAVYTGDDAYLRLAWYEARALLFGAAVFALFVPVTVVLVWPVRWLWRRARHRPPSAPAARAGMAATYAACACITAFAAGFGLFLWTVNPHVIGYGPPPTLRALLCLPLAAAMLYPIMLGCFLRGVQQRWWGLPTAAHYTLAVIATPLLLLLLHYWNLLGFRFG